VFDGSAAERATEQDDARKTEAPKVMLQKRLGSLAVVSSSGLVEPVLRALFPHWETLSESEYDFSSALVVVVHCALP
jgi:hypothetical protein